MRELKFLVNEVRIATDNVDENGVKDREISRYFADGVKAIQAIVFKNNPLCSYFQKSVEFPSASTRVYTLPSDCYGQNAVSRVEVKGAGDRWSTLKRVWPEDGYFGWYTQNNTLVLSGDEGESFPEVIRVTYFYRLARPALKLSTIQTPAVSSILCSETFDNAEAVKTDTFVTVTELDGTIIQSGLRADSITLGTTIALNASTPLDLGLVSAGDSVVLGSHSTFKVDLPDECEPFLLDYVQKRVFGRNNYSAEARLAQDFTEEDKMHIASIFGDAGQSITDTPITDTDFMGI